MGKIITFTLSVLFVLAACTAPNTIPEDLEGKKKALSALKTERTVLDQQISQLQKEINKLEPIKLAIEKLVTASDVVKKDFKRYIDIQGSVQSSDAVYASPETGGRIIHMTIEEGDYVKSGSLIAKLDVESINNQIIEIEKSLELATDVFQRQERLWNQEIGSEIQFLQAKNNMERLEKSLESVKFQLTKANVYAPISGYADEVFLQKGELASPGAPIVQIINTNTIKVVADVPESLLGKVKKGEFVEIEFPALNDTRRGKVTLIGRSIDPANRTFKVEVDMPNKGNVLKPNLLSIMKINDLTVKNTIAIPLELVQQEISGRDYVFVTKVAPEGIISEKKYVQTGATFEDEIVIETGLDEGDQIIVDGARGLAANELIKIQ